VTVFRGQPDLNIPRDTEAVKIWKRLFETVGIEAKDIDFSEQEGLQAGRIFYYNENKNWWSRVGAPKNMPVGELGGPDSEVFYDFGDELQLHENSVFSTQQCHVNCDCGRFLEIGNNVFMTYIRTEKGFELLKQKNIDFGGGFERILAALNNDPDIFTTALFQPLIAKIEAVSGKKYSPEDLNTQRSFRVISDHLRAATMLAADGVYPSNKEQGYVARRLIRRAVRYGRMIGIRQAFVSQMAQEVITLYGDAYPEVQIQADQIKKVLGDEEEKFNKTLDKGLREIEHFPELTGEIAFQLYETYGFPLELTKEIAVERGQHVDTEAFAKAFNLHKEKSRTASAGKFKGGLEEHSEVTTKFHTATHLLHAALRKILGTHVQQKGSNITVERLRFDFSHPQALTPTEIEHVSAQMNEWIKADLPVTLQKMKKTDALKSGAIAFFIEKYPDQVTVYTIGKDVESDWISKEFCGGPHVSSTGQIGPVRILKEQSASAGIRRIYIQFQ